MKVRPPLRSSRPVRAPGFSAPVSKPPTPSPLCIPSGWSRRTRCGRQLRRQAARVDRPLGPPRPTPRRTFLRHRPLGGRGCHLAWRLKGGQNRHKVERQRSNKRPESPPGGNAQNPRGRHLPHGCPPRSSLAAAVTARSRGNTRVAAPLRGPCSRTPPGPSSQPLSAAARAPGDRGAAPSPAPRGWRGRPSGPDLEGGRERH